MKEIASYTWRKLVIRERGVVTAGDACATGTAEMGAKPYLSANRRCLGLELPGAVLARTAGDFPFEEEGVGGSSPC